MMRHFSSYNLRCKVMSRIGKEWWQVIYFAGHLEKVVLKKRYRQIECKKEEICNEIKEAITLAPPAMPADGPVIELLFLFFKLNLFILVKTIK